MQLMLLGFGSEWRLQVQGHQIHNAPSTTWMEECAGLTARSHHPVFFAAAKAMGVRIIRLLVSLSQNKSSNRALLMSIQCLQSEIFPSLAGAPFTSLNCDIRWQPQPNMWRWGASVWYRFIFFPFVSRGILLKLPVTNFTTCFDLLCPLSSAPWCP